MSLLWPVPGSLGTSARVGSKSTQMFLETMATMVPLQGQNDTFRPSDGIKAGDEPVMERQKNM